MSPDDQTSRARRFIWDANSVRLLSQQPIPDDFDIDASGDDSTKSVTISIGSRVFVRRGTPAAVADGMHATKAVAPLPDPRDADEAALREALETLFREIAPDVADMLAKGQMPSDKELAEAFSAVIRPQLVEAAVNEFNRLSDVGVSFDPALVNQRMVDWASTYTYELVKGINDTTRASLRQALSEYANTPGMTRGQLETLIRTGGFSPARAEAIAVTEVTRAHSRAQSAYQQEMANSGITMERVWRTAHDEHVCPICGPLSGKPEDRWKGDYPDGPPAHVRCRCSTTLRSAEKPFSETRMGVPGFDEWVDSNIMPAPADWTWPHARSATPAEVRTVQQVARSLPPEVARLVDQDYRINVHASDNGGIFDEFSGGAGHMVISAQALQKPNDVDKRIILHEFYHAAIAPQVMHRPQVMFKEHELIDDLVKSGVRTPTHVNKQSGYGGSRPSATSQFGEYTAMIGGYYQPGDTVVTHARRIVRSKTFNCEKTPGSGEGDGESYELWTQREAELAVAAWREWMGIA